VPGFWSQTESVVDLAAIDSVVIAALQAKLAAARIAVVVQDMTSDVGVPAFAARLFDLTHPESGTAVGYGCHLETEVALVRAITEAVQGRTVVQVAGSRDDITKYERWTMKLFAGEIDRCQHLLAGATHVPQMQQAGGSFAADLAELVERLERSGMPEVAVVELTQSPFPVSVVRVVIPGLEGIWTFPSYTPGDRANARIRRTSEARPA
jgi:ribosomal protein S12 methylthiotransferase accessory factor